MGTRVPPAIPRVCADSGLVQKTEANGEPSPERSQREDRKPTAGDSPQLSASGNNRQRNLGQSSRLCLFWLTVESIQKPVCSHYWTRPWRKQEVCPGTQRHHLVGIVVPPMDPVQLDPALGKEPKRLSGPALTPHSVVGPIPLPSSVQSLIHIFIQ